MQITRIKQKSSSIHIIEGCYQKMVDSKKKLGYNKVAKKGRCFLWQ